MSKFAYSRSLHPAIEGRIYRNPRHYTGPEESATDVLIVGKWPVIESDYGALGRRVTVVDDGSLPSEPAPAPTLTAEELNPPFDPGSVVIGDDWRDLKWSQPNEHNVTLRSLASAISEAPITNKEEAIKAIEAELARRAKADEAVGEQSQ